MSSNVPPGAGSTGVRRSRSTFVEPVTQDTVGEAENYVIDDDFDTQAAPTRSSAVRWATDKESPCYWHLLRDGQPSLNVDKSFVLTRRELDLIIDANAYRPVAHGDVIAFGIRGATIRGGEKVENADSLPLEDARPNHLNYRCVVGWYYRKTGKISAYTGSTVPWHAYMSKGLTHNLLPPGCYVYKLGTHRPANQSNWLTPALRLSDRQLSESGRVTVLRNTDDLIFDYDDRWHECNPSDNVHCAYSTTGFSSLGCQTIKGGKTDGLWADFARHMRTLPPSARVDYVLFTGAEGSIAASLTKGGVTPDKTAVLNSLARLRFGSEGERVNRLQAKLKVATSGYFDAATKTALLAYQDEHDLTSDGIYTPTLDTKLGWGVFTDAPAVSTPVAGTGQQPAQTQPQQAASAQPQPPPQQAPAPQTQPPPQTAPSPQQSPAQPTGTAAAAPAPPTAPPATSPSAPPSGSGSAGSSAPSGAAATAAAAGASSATLAAIAALAQQAKEEGNAGFGMSETDAAPTPPAAPPNPPVVDTKPPQPPAPPQAPPQAPTQTAVSDAVPPKPAPPQAPQQPPQAPTQPTQPTAAGTGAPPAVVMTTPSLKKFAPKAREDYLKVLSEQGNEVLTRFAINKTEQRFCHFMAQVGHECGGFTIVEESGAYSAPGIMRIFGVGRHSASVTDSEAQQIAAIQPVSKRAEVLFERVYGPARSPRKARDLGNTQPGDGYRYRGRGFLQITGRSAYREMGKRIGIDLEANPDLAGQPLGALMTAAAFWESRKLNTYADQDNIELITKRINGGHNGLADRKAKYALALEIWGEDGEGTRTRAPTRSLAGQSGGRRTLEYGDLGQDVLELKRMLATLGYEGFVMDEDFSKATHLAVASFQIDRGQTANGIVDPPIWELIEREARAAGYAPHAPTRSRGPAGSEPETSDGAREPASPNLGRGRAVWIWGYLILLLAAGIAGIKFLENPAVLRSQAPLDWAALTIAGLIGIGAIIQIALGGRVARLNKRRAAATEAAASAAGPAADVGMPREVNGG